MEKAFSIIADRTGIRLDRFIAEKQPQLSRTLVKKLVTDGHITVNDKSVKASLKQD